MTDRELLELAAKAAGLKEYGWMAGTLTHVVNNQFVFWNPLTDDGDALRLAATLNLCVIWFPMSSTPKRSVTAKRYGESAPVYRGEIQQIEASELLDAGGGDHSAATRRAITRAAAAIGARDE